MRTRILTVLWVICLVATFVGAGAVLLHKVPNAGYAVVPMVFTLVLNVLVYLSSRKDGKPEEKKEPEDPENPGE
ncbi:MAG: hypothetical protein IJ055_06225 [Oscillospiraceae bacterium]|nr:hypothetical protein [Oscillospiraceae bacterium]